MNKAVIPLVVTLSVLAGCSRNEIIDINTKTGDYIGFDPGTAKITRAQVVYLSDLQNADDGFVVTCEKSDNEFLFQNAPYAYNSGEWNWKNSPQMWPTDAGDYPLNFYAAYPANVPIPATLERTITISEAVGDQRDYLAATIKGVMRRPPSGKISLPFKHITARVDFAVSTPANVTVEVTEIRIWNAYDKGRFSYSTLTYSELTGGVSGNEFKYLTSPIKPANTFTGIGVGNVVPDQTNGSFMLMPQQLTAWSKGANLTDGAYIEVVYRAYDSAGNDLVGYSAGRIMHNASIAASNLYVKVGFPIDTEWEMGKSYKYVMTLGNTSLSGGYVTDTKFFNPNGQRTAHTLEDPRNSSRIYAIGNPINTAGAKGFHVTVVDWDETPADI